MRFTLSFRLFPVTSYLLFMAGCCCCGMSGTNFQGGGNWSPTPSPHIVNVRDDNFTSEVLQSDKPTLVDFWAPWCGPCRSVDPAFVAVAEELHADVKFCRVNTDENQMTSTKYQVWSIPTLALFSDGELVDQHVGVPDGDITQQTRDWVLQHIETEDSAEQ